MRRPSRFGRTQATCKRRRKFADYLRNFLTSPEGAFYTSQDADLVPGEHSADYFALDDKRRRQRGVPRIDRHIYARENGWAINALATFAGITNDTTALDDAIRAANWIIAHRSLGEGGFQPRRERPGRALLRRQRFDGACLSQPLPDHSRPEMAGTRRRHYAFCSERNSRAPPAIRRSADR